MVRLSPAILGILLATAPGLAQSRSIAVQTGFFISISQELETPRFGPLVRTGERHNMY